MREFFKPWRRKAGVVTLVLACLFMAAWMRSLYPRSPFPLPAQFLFDEQTWKFGFLVWRENHTVDRFTLKDSSLTWERIQADAPVAVTNVIGVFFNATDANFPDIGRRSNAWTSYRECGGFAVGRFQLNEGRFNLQIARVVFPFWAIVLPLTVLSAYLLLSKPRQAKSAAKSDFAR